MQRINIRAFPPYRSWLDGQSELVLKVEGPILVREMWARLSRAYPRFGELLAYETDEELSRALIVLQDGRLLGPADMVKPGAPVELLPSIGGGEGERGSLSWPENDQFHCSAPSFTPGPFPLASPASSPSPACLTLSWPHRCFGVIITEGSWNAMVKLAPRARNWLEMEELG